MNSFCPPCFSSPSLPYSHFPLWVQRLYMFLILPVLTICPVQHFYHYQNMVFWIVTPCSLIDEYQCFRGTWCPHSGFIIITTQKTTIWTITTANLIAICFLFFTLFCLSANLSNQSQDISRILFLSTFNLYIVCV
jgi:hypothetical protein